MSLSLPDFVQRWKASTLSERRPSWLAEAHCKLDEAIFAAVEFPRHG
jgi:hypothetical protein